MFYLGVDEPKPDDKKFSQADIDRVVQERLSREKEKYRDYDELVKFKETHQKELDAKTLKEQEATKEYGKAKETYEKKIAELSAAVTSKEQEIARSRVNHELTMEISAQNGYLDEALALLSGAAVVDSNGTIIIKAKDANGVDINLSVKDGVKQFLEKRPHLVKATTKQGGNTPPGNGGGGNQQGSDDLSQLNADLMAAQNRGDTKAIREVTEKIKAVYSRKGIRRVI
jgi:hypothetical protein